MKRILEALISLPIQIRKKNSRKNSLPSFAVRYDWLAHWWWAVRNSKFSKLFLCTEIFSKRRKICALWRETWDALMHQISHSFCPMMFLQLNWFFQKMVDFSVSNSSLDWLMITCFMGRIKLSKFFHLQNSASKILEWSRCFYNYISMQMIGNGNWKPL